LAQAIAAAEAVGADSHLLRHANARLGHVEEHSGKRHALAKAEHGVAQMVQSETDAVSLATALETAREAGVSRGILETGWNRKVALELQAWRVQKRELASQRLNEATRNAVLGPLEDAITYASDCGVSKEFLQRACHRVDALKEREHMMVAESRRASETSSSQMSSVPPARPPAAADFGSRGVVATPPIQHNQSEQELQTSSTKSLFESQKQELKPQRDSGLQQDEFMKPKRDSGVQAVVEESRDVPVTACEPSPARTPNGVVRRPSGPRSDLPVYGLDAELKAKAENKYDQQAEEEASHWVQSITGVTVVGDLFNALRTGDVLCQLINCIRPGTITKINTSKMPFKERENISHFLQACRKWGVQEYALFNTDDLYEENNLLSVVRCLHALGGAIKSSVPEFHGPCLGVADKSNAKREEKRSFRPTQTGGLQCAMMRSHVDVTSGQIVRGGC